MKTRRIPKNKIVSAAAFVFAKAALFSVKNADYKMIVGYGKDDYGRLFIAPV